MNPAVLWVLAAVFVLVGLAGTVLPGLPGTLFVYGGLILGAWAGDFERVGGWTLAALGALTALSFVTDLATASLGTRRAGATRWAAAGAAAGGVVGLLFGLPGVLLGPFLGAVAGELLAVRDLIRAGKAGFGASVGFLLGTVVRVGLAFAMVGVFAAAYLW